MFHELNQIAGMIALEFAANGHFWKLEADNVLFSR